MNENKLGGLHVYYGFLFALMKMAEHAIESLAFYNNYLIQLITGKS